MSVRRRNAVVLFVVLSKIVDVLGEHIMLYTQNLYVICQKEIRMMYYRIVVIANGI